MNTSIYFAVNETDYLTNYTQGGEVSNLSTACHRQPWKVELWLSSKFIDCLIKPIWLNLFRQDKFGEGGDEMGFIFKEFFLLELEPKELIESNQFLPVFYQ